MHALASLICSQVLEDVACPSQSMRCCVDAPPENGTSAAANSGKAYFYIHASKNILQFLQTMTRSLYDVMIIKIELSSQITSINISFTLLLQYNLKAKKVVEDATKTQPAYLCCGK